MGKNRQGNNTCSISFLKSNLITIIFKTYNNFNNTKTISFVFIIKVYNTRLNCIKAICLSSAANLLIIMFLNSLFVEFHSIFKYWHKYERSFLHRANPNPILYLSQQEKDLEVFIRCWTYILSKGDFEKVDEKWCWMIWKMQVDTTLQCKRKKRPDWMYRLLPWTCQETGYWWWLKATCKYVYTFGCTSITCFTLSFV